MADAVVFIAITRECKRIRLTRKAWTAKLLTSRQEFQQRSDLNVKERLYNLSFLKAHRVKKQRRGKQKAS